MESGEFKKCLDSINKLDEKSKNYPPIKLAFINCLVGLGDLLEAESLLKINDFGDHEENKTFLLLKIYYLSGKQTEFTRLIEFAKVKIPYSPFLSSISWHASISWGINDLYNFCPDPLSYIKYIPVDDSEQFKSLIHNGEIFLSGGYLKNSSGFELSSNRRIEEIILKLIEVYKNEYSLKKNEYLSALNTPVKIEYWGISTLGKGEIAPHIHSGLLSGIIFCNDDDKFGPTVFSEKCPDLPEELSITFKSIKITPKKNFAVLFPASVNHLVEINKSNNPRLTIPFNAYF